MNKVRASVIGSLPRLADNLTSSISYAIDLQLKHDIEVISDGEQRSDMIEYFTDLPGIASHNGRAYIRDKITAPQNPEKTFKILDLTIAQNYLKKIGRGETPIKLSLTGPVTLGFTCASYGLKKTLYQSIAAKQLYSDIANALNPIIQEGLQRGAHIQIDEPALSARYLAPSTTIEMINLALEGIVDTYQTQKKMSLHVCGNLTKVPTLLNQLTKVNAGILSIAFAGKNEIANQELPLDNIVDVRKFLGIGCISVGVKDQSQVGTVDEAISIVRAVVQKIGLQNIFYLHPDCGLRSTPLPIAEKILDVTSKTVKKISETS
jgi:methionine synthase II (cobalamin-independent)